MVMATHLQLPYGNNQAITTPSLYLCKIKGQPLSCIYIYIFLWSMHGEPNDVTSSDSSTFLQEDSCQYSNPVSLLTVPMGDVTENWVAVVGTPFSLRLPVASDYDVGTVTQSFLHVCTSMCVHMIEHVACLHVITVRQSRWHITTIDIRIDWLADCLQPITRLV